MKNYPHLFFDKLNVIFQNMIAEMNRRHDIFIKRSRKMNQ